jgi:hypothetical protein
VILSAPALAPRNLPVVSLTRAMEPKGLNASQTIPFKNVLDSLGLENLDVLDTPSGESAAGDQKADSQGTPFKKNATDVSGQPQNIAPQHSITVHSAPQIPYPTQNLAPLTATLTRPVEEPVQEPAQEAAPEAVNPQQTGQGEIEPAKAPIQATTAQRPTMVARSTASTPRFGASVQAPNAPATAAPASLANTGSTKTSPAAPPAPDNSEVQTKAKATPTASIEARTTPREPAAVVKSEAPKSEAPKSQTAPKLEATPKSEAPPSPPVKPTTTVAATPSLVETAPVPTPVTTTAAPAPVAKQSAPPAPPAKSKDATTRRTASVDSTPSASAPANETLPTAAAPAVTPVAPAPGPAPEKIETAKPESETPNTSTTPRDEAAKVTIAASAAPKTPLEPKAENLAFEVRMVAPESSSSNAPVAPAKPIVVPATPAEAQISEPKQAPNQPKAATPAPSPVPETQQPQAQASTSSKHDTQTPATATEKTDPRAPKPADVPQPADMRATVTRWSEVSMPQPTEFGSARVSSELAEPAHASPALAAQETHLMAPEMPKTSASSEILLHLTAEDQSTAAIRVADRAGSVNVTVHASDPVLRESLRSNLGELSTQLSAQGWKAESVKPAAIAAQAESQQQDSHGGGQRSPQQQQQSFGGDRQPQRDRRNPGGIWQQELEQQISGGDAHPGGNR